MSIITGYEGIKCGVGAVYTVLAELLGEVYGETVLPIFPKEQAIGTTQTFPFKIADARAQHFCYVFYMFRRESLYAQFRIR